MHRTPLLSILLVAQSTCDNFHNHHRFIQWIQNEAEPLENNGVGWTKTWAKQYWWCTKRLRRPTKYANLPKCWGRAIFSLILSYGVIDLEIFPKCHPSLLNTKFSPTFWYLSLWNMQAGRKGQFGWLSTYFAFFSTN